MTDPYTPPESDLLDQANLFEIDPKKIRYYHFWAILHAAVTLCCIILILFDLAFTIICAPLGFFSLIRLITFTLSYFGSKKMLMKLDRINKKLD